MSLCKIIEDITDMNLLTIIVLIRLDWYKGGWGKAGVKIAMQAGPFQGLI